MKKTIDHIMFELRRDAPAFGIMVIATIIATAVIVTAM